LLILGAAVLLSLCVVGNWSGQLEADIEAFPERLAPLLEAYQARYGEFPRARALLIEFAPNFLARLAKSSYSSTKRWKIPHPPCWPNHLLHIDAHFSSVL
jgi:hypothetical protein